MAPLSFHHSPLPVFVNLLLSESHVWSQLMKLNLPDHHDQTWPVPVKMATSPFLSLRGNLVPGSLKLGLRNRENIGRGGQVTGDSG